MISLTPIQWNVLTFLQSRKGRVRNSDIQARCGLASKAATVDVLLSLQAKGLVQCDYFMQDGVKIRCARSDARARGMVGLEVPVLEVA